MKARKTLRIIRDRQELAKGFEIPTDLTWELNYTLIMFIRDGIKKFLKVTDCYPVDLFLKYEIKDNDRVRHADDEKAMKEWKDTLAEIINMCDDIIADNYISGEELEKKNKKLLEKLGTILHNLWW